MIRSRAKAGSAVPALLVAIALAFGSAAPARAQVQVPLASPAAATYWFAGTRLGFERPQVRGGALAVATTDAGLARILMKTGTTLSYERGQSYVVLSTGDRRTITFTIGDPHYDVGSTVATASFAPYVAGGAAYLPFAELVRALALMPLADADGTIVLQPQLASLDVRSLGRAVVATFRGATALRFKRLSGDADDHVTLAFSGVGSALERERELAAPALSGVTISQVGSLRNPTTVVDFRSSAGAVHALAPTDSPNAIAVAFAPAGVALGGTPVPLAGDATVAVAPLTVRDAAAPAVANAPPANVTPGNGPPPFPPALGIPGASPGGPQAAATPTALGLAPASVDGLRLDPFDQGLDVVLGIAGPVTYEWHRLPDNRWYVDLKPATLALEAGDVPVTSDAVLGLRIKGFVGPNDHLPTVRVALTLASPRIVTLSATNDGLVIAVDRLDDLDPQRTAAGELADGKLVASVVPLPAVAAPPPDDAGGGPGDTPPGWKFSPPGVNPRLIVIDPGHGGSDRGAMHNDLTEAILNLSVAKHLQALLVARGWTVRMTRETDVDVYQPNDSAHDELQARCDVANNAGARLFISIHTNSFTSGDLNGTTTYYYKSDSYGLARAVHARLASDLPTQDDGIRKENFYVIHHTNAPAILVEMAFLSNASDARLLKSDGFLQSVAASIANGVGDYASPGSDGN